MKVVIRVRPVTNIDYKLSRSKTSGPEICVNVKSDGQTLELIKDPYNSRHYRYDYIFTSLATQETIYQYACADLVKDYLNGYHASILCYGQTGTGKTYTMFGTMDTWNLPQHSNSGILQQSLNTIFNYISQCHQQVQEKRRYARLYLSFYEIYLENITDLLLSTSSNKGPGKKGTSSSLNIRESVEKGVYVDSLSIFPVDNPEEIYALIQRAVSYRVTHGLDMNETSSRSHAILQLTLEQEAPPVSSAAPAASSNDPYIPPSPFMNERKRVIKNVLTFCDLAGSERVHRLGPKNQNIRLREAQNINRSICALGNCIQALSAQSKSEGGGGGAQHIPYRDSKLTRLLSETLSGNSRTCIISTIGPCSHSYEETLSTLIFSSRAATVKKVVKQVKPVPGIFSGLSETIQNWKWPPPITQIPNHPESDNDIGNDDNEIQENEEEPPLPPPQSPPADEQTSPFLSNQKNQTLFSFEENDRPPSVTSSQRTRPKSATSDLSTSDSSYLYPLTLEDLGVPRTLPLKSPQQPRRHSSSGESRRKIQLHPTIILKRLSEEAVIPSREKSPLSYLSAERSSHSPSPPHHSHSHSHSNHHLSQPTTPSEAMNPSLEMLAADEYNDHYRSSPEMPFSRDIHFQSIHSEYDSQSPLPFPQPQQPQQRREHLPLTPKSSTGNSLFSVFDSTPSRHFEMDFATTLEKELDSFRLTHDLHEVSPPPSLGDKHKDTDKEEKIQRRSSQRLERNQKEREVDSNNIIPHNSDQPKRFKLSTKPLPQTASSSRQASSSFSSSSLPKSHHPPQIVSSPVKIIVLRDLVKLSRVPPPPSTPPPQYPSPPNSRIPSPAPPLKADQATSTDLVLCDQATNTPLPTPFNHDPCPHCTISRNEIIILKNEITRHIDDIHYLKGLIEPDPDSYEAVVSMKHGHGQGKGIGNGNGSSHERSSSR